MYVLFIILNQSIKMITVYCYDKLIKVIANYRALYLIAEDRSGSYLFQKIQSCVVSRTLTVIINTVLMPS